MKTNQPEKREAWIEKFDIKASQLGLDGEQMDEVRDFIRQVVRQAKVETWEEARRIMTQSYRRVDLDSLDEVDQAISRLKNNEK